MECPAGPKCTPLDNHNPILYKHNIITQAALAVVPGNQISSVQFTLPKYVFCSQHAALGPAVPYECLSWHCSTVNGYQKSESFSRVLLNWHDVHKYRCSIGLKMMATLWLSILFPSWMGLTPLDSWYVERQLSLTCANILLAWSSSLALICINWST